MRWTHTNKLEDEKTKSVFLWLPTRIDNETRWLERAEIRYTWWLRPGFFRWNVGWTATSWE
jgi:hypothetical protein